MKFLIVQTAFIGDVILATALVEKLHGFYPGAQIDVLVRGGNEKLLEGHPKVHQVLVWEKRRAKYRNLIGLVGRLRRERYDWVINCQRFGASGLLTLLAGAGRTVGFAKNPFARLFSRRVAHRIGPDGPPVHEVTRNQALIAHLTDELPAQPRLYPGVAERAAVAGLLAGLAPGQVYVCIAPTSVWFTKQYPAHRWVELIRRLPANCGVFLLGSPADRAANEQIRAAAAHPGVRNTAGELSLLASAVLLEGAAMNYVNDSAPLHLASAMDAPVAAVFCSTLPAFGFTPLSSRSVIVETRHPLVCRPCGLHGRPACPLGHFACAETIRVDDFPLPGV